MITQAGSGMRMALVGTQGVDVFFKELKMPKYYWPASERPGMSKDELLEIGAEVARRSFTDPELLKKVRAANIITRFLYVDKEAWGPDVVAELNVDFTKNPIEIVTGPIDREPTITMSMEPIIGHLFWMKRLNLMVAVTRGMIKVKGPIHKGMKLLPALKPVYANYPQVLREYGREDVLSFPP